MAWTQHITELLHDAHEARARFGRLNVRPIVHGHIDHCLWMVARVLPRLCLALLLLRLFFLFFVLLGSGEAALESLTVYWTWRMTLSTRLLLSLSILWSRSIWTSDNLRSRRDLSSNHCSDNKYLCLVDIQSASNCVFVFSSTLFLLLPEGLPKKFATADVGPLLARALISSGRTSVGLLVRLRVEIRQDDRLWWTFAASCAVNFSPRVLSLTQICQYSLWSLCLLSYFTFSEAVLLRLWVVLQIKELRPDQHHAFFRNEQTPVHLPQEHGLQSVQFLEVEAPYLGVEVIPGEFVVVHLAGDHDSCECNSVCNDWLAIRKTIT